MSFNFKSRCFLLLQVTHQMYKNVELTMNQVGNLEEIGKRTKELQEKAGNFVKKTEEIKRKMWWKNCKVSIEKD